MEDSGRHSLVGTTNSGQPQPQQGVNTTTAPATGSPPGAPMQPLSVPETMARETGAPSQEISQPPPQAMSAFAPFLVQPMFPQHILQQQLNHTNTQAMIQNLLQSHNNHNSQSATVNSVLSTTNETSDQQHISTTQQSPTENQAPSMTAIQNLIRLTTPQGMTPNFQPWNASHFNMLQNLITMNSAQTQNDPSMTPIDDTPSAQTETLAASQIQQSQNAFHAIQPSAQIPNPAGNASISTGSQPAYAFPSFLKINTLPTTQTTGYWLAPPFPAVYGGMVLPPSQLITQPNPLMMQNLFTQITTNPVPTALQPVVGSPTEVPSSASIPPNGTMAVTRDNLHETSRNKHGLPMLIYMDFDEETLTDYQCLLRKQIELFEAGPEDVKASAQGRNNPIYLGQIGIRCRFCATLPLKCRPRGAVYYSKTIDGLYQVAQNMSKLHFCRTCKLIPKDLQQHLDHLQKVNRRASGGKEYWAEGLRVLGVYEDGHGMRYSHSNNREMVNASSAEVMSERRIDSRNSSPTSNAARDEVDGSSNNSCSNSHCLPGACSNNE